ncbi:winged helix-turn-helix transcriptional regulator [Pelosinus sp. sgz500959]|uniref:winged helix-turn-helix transcriptional regulator n=1 Tax=Pelosinus sp. sgz500959 TaxID=3242472 RepID=UPI00367284B4
MKSYTYLSVSNEYLRSDTIEVTVNLLGDKWKALIMRILLLKGTQRFGELGRGINGTALV